MARRRRYRSKRKGRKQDRSVPVVQTATLAIPIWKAVNEQGFTVAGVDHAVYNLTGFSVAQGAMLDWKKGAMMAVVLLAESTIGRKIATKTGANRLMKKVSMGYLKLM